MSRTERGTPDAWSAMCRRNNSCDPLRARREEDAAIADARELGDPRQALHTLEDDEVHVCDMDDRVDALEYVVSELRPGIKVALLEEPTVEDRIRRVIESLDRICSACMAANSQETWNALHAVGRPACMVLPERDPTAIDGCPCCRPDTDKIYLAIGVLSPETLSAHTPKRGGEWWLDPDVGVPYYWNDPRVER